MVDKNAAILIDAIALINPRVMNWAKIKSRHAAIVILNSSPEKILTNIEEYLDIAATLTNTKNLDDLVFKTAALCVIQDSSNLIPVVAIDNNPEILNMFEEGGVIATFQPEQV